MSLVSQADFARMHGVSRKAVTTWKSRGYLTFSGTLVDVERSNEKLARLGRAWPGIVAPVTGPPDPTVSVTPTIKEWPAVVTEPDGYDWTSKNGWGKGVERAAVKLSVMVESAVSNMARLTVRYLEPQVALPLLDEFHRIQREGALSLLDDEYDPPAGYASWAYHPLFQGPAMAFIEWEEALAEATEWRKRQAGADA